MFAKRFPFSYLAFSILLLSAQMMFAQVTITSVFPSQNALGASRDTQIMATFSNPIDLSSLNDTTVVVSGRQTGLHPGTIKYNTTTQTLTWTSETDFTVGEVVTVILTRSIKPMDSQDFQGFVWQFWIKVNNPTNAHFTLVKTLDWPEKTRDLNLADYNGDGSIDLVLIGDAFGTVALWFNDGNANFNQQGFYPILKIPRGGMFGDFDRNSGLDIGLSIRQGLSSNPDPIIFLWNDATGIFADTTHFLTKAGALGRTPFSNDIDSDGYLDLVMTDFYRNQTFVYKNLGHKSFRLISSTETGLGSSVPGLADFNSNGVLDIVVSVFDSNRTKESTKLLFNDGRGDFQSIGLLDSLVTVRLIGDLDNDNDVDVGFHWTIDESLSVYLNDGMGDFSLNGKYFVGQHNNSNCLGDFDGDGDLDLVEVGFKVISAMPVIYQGFYRLVINDGTGRFILAYEDTLGQLVNNVDCADLDEDGDLDLVIAENRRPFYILLNEDKATGILDSRIASVSTEINLLHIYPNPFNRETTLEFRLDQPGDIDLSIYDIIGKEVKELVKRYLSRGGHRITWDGLDKNGKEVSSGVYIVVLKTIQKTEAMKILMMK